ncbi:MAG TPA: hypothetical protein VN258_15210 [Mobilitalea sp.]|nr:hypothetical protein [Mobilitalea sp.]
MKHSNRKREIVLPVITILIMLIIVLMAGITRVFVREDKSDITIGSITSYQDAKLYMSEIQILTMLMKTEEDMINQKNLKNDTYDIYTSNLKSYLSKSHLDINAADFDLLKDKIVELTDIMNIEQECDFTKMSIDGRAVATDIAKQIYKICGLNLLTNMQGNIVKITDQSDNIIYSAKGEQPGYHLQIPILIVVLCVLVSLLVFLLVVVRKHKLFYKEVNFDEFNEERYA